MSQSSSVTGPVHQGIEGDTPSARRTTDVVSGVDVIDAERVADAIRAAGLKLAGALPEDQRAAARGEVRRLSVDELALQLPDWVSVVTRAQPASGAVSGHLLKQVCDELAGPLSVLQRGLHDVRRGDMDLASSRFAEDVAFAGGRVRHLINDLLDLSGLIEGRLSTAKLHFQVRDCFSAALQELAPRAAAHDTEVTLDVRAAVPVTVVGDPGRLRQVVSTLVGNAIAGSSGDEIRVTLSARPDERDGSAPARTADVILHGRVSRRTVEGRHVGLRRNRRDSGGVSWRGDARTGLGLAISRQLVSRMGGQTWVESGDDGGSVLHFTVRCGLSSGDSGAWQQVRTGGSARVLVVARTGTSVDTLTRQLEAAGAAVVVSRSADEAQRRLGAALGSAAFDVVCVAATLTSRRGSALAEAVSQIVRRPPTALITSEGHRGDASRCRALGFNAYLTQPLAHRDVRDTLRALTAPDHPGQVDYLITRHFLRETRRQLDVVIEHDGRRDGGSDGALDDVSARLRGLGHTVQVGRAAAWPVDRSFDVLVVDASGRPLRLGEAREARARWGSAAPPGILLLVDNPADLPPGTDLGRGTGALSRDHDARALAEALLRLRQGGGLQRAGLEPDGPPVWPGVLRRAEGDDQLAREIAQAFVTAAPRALDRVHAALDADDELGCVEALVSLRSALATVDLRAAAQLCEHLEAALLAGRDVDVTLGQLEHRVHQAQAKLRASLERRRYSGRVRA